MTTATRPRTPATRYRFDRKFNVIRDTRTMTTSYLDAVKAGYTTGDPLFVPRSSSPARVKFKAIRAAARQAARSKGGSK